MKTQIDQTQWGFSSLSWWLTLILAIGIILIGIRFIISPSTGAVGFGIAFTNVNDGVYGKIKDIRDAFSGLVLLPLLLMKMRKAAAWVFTVAIIVPTVDCVIVIYTNGLQDSAHWLIHGSTAIIMIFNSMLLFKGLKN
ncbi:DUF4267 domain-containing protein [Mucilaginibacter sp. SP1R1]|uniref:DUF4267 domain-containing protein n=1 Tax=Mucilaginibacter sp. SP1R1 TaxID=2723091 RepID=UPI0016172208|nr:DUF4267 domain-containing protein [Mucilaginibacter sp. SP1R1]MBB6148943.1 hypothetical protein [Mucilaginibacter sp. SP1R1]